MLQIGDSFIVPKDVIMQIIAEYMRSQDDLKAGLDGVLLLSQQLQAFEAETGTQMPPIPSLGQHFMQLSGRMALVQRILEAIIQEQPDRKVAA